LDLDNKASIAVVGVRLINFSVNLLRSLLYCGVLQISFSLVSVSRAATYVVPDQRDRDVLNSLLIHLCTDPAFDLTKVSTNDPQILLHFRTPEGTGFLTPGQIRSDLRTNSLPIDAEDNLRKRNGLNVENPGDYETVAALFGNVKFSAGIVVTNLHHWRIEPQILKTGFNKAFPNARGWVEVYLPGYSNDGNVAVVRAMVGPWAHAASLTALMEKRENGWFVKWFKIAYYA
jgi:hypothetical protein